MASTCHTIEEEAVIAGESQDIEDTEEVGGLLCEIVVIGAK